MRYTNNSFGFYWGTNTESLYNKVTVNVAESAITADLSALKLDTQYFFQSYASFDGEELKEAVKSFTTKEIESILKTGDASDIEATKAILNAKLDLTDVQYCSIYYGFYLGTSESSQNAFLSGEDIVDHAFTSEVSNLSHKTQYWYIAYVKLDGQSFYGEAKTFTTDVVKVESVSLDKTKYTFNTIGNTITLIATILPADATDKSVEWSSDKQDVATVDTDGKVTAKGNGKAIITVKTKDQGKTASCEVSVIQYIEKVDMGIKTADGKSLYWSTRNLCNTGLVGSPDEYWDYYAWGETDSKSNYNCSIYKWCNGASSSFMKYNTNSSYRFVDNKTVLDSEDDVAHLKLGDSWRLPKDSEWKKLMTKCTWTWTDNYNSTGVRGRIITASNGNSIFLPAAGGRYEADL